MVNFYKRVASTFVRINTYIILFSTPEQSCFCIFVFVHCFYIYLFIFFCCFLFCHLSYASNFNCFRSMRIRASMPENWKKKKNNVNTHFLRHMAFYSSSILFHGISNPHTKCWYLYPLPILICRILCVNGRDIGYGKQYKKTNHGIFNINKLGIWK